MARPIKKRKVCGLPKNDSFGPLGRCLKKEGVINLSVDEYEAIRLIDLEGYTQAECADQMHVARTTVQGIYSDARKKISESLVKGKILNIDGGNYKLCSGKGKRCNSKSCSKLRRDL